jgi:hypothetical protein
MGLSEVRPWWNIHRRYERCKSRTPPDPGPGGLRDEDDPESGEDVGKIWAGEPNLEIIRLIVKVHFFSQGESS